MGHTTDSGSPCCQKSAGDGLEAARRDDTFDRDATSWLIGQSLRYLNAQDTREEIAYRRVIELLDTHRGAVAALAQAFHDSPREDHNLRWSLLYILSEIGDASAAESFFTAAAEPVPARDRYEQGCETPRDGEILVRTMAIAGLARLAAKEAKTKELFYRLIEAQPERALRVEAAKQLLLLDPQAAERVKGLLPEELHFALQLKIVRAESLAVEHDAIKADATTIPPEMGAKPRSPRACHCHSHCS